jgi:hypothetical protein
MIKKLALCVLLFPAIAAAQAVERIVYVDTDCGTNGNGTNAACGASGPYSNLNNALSAETKDLVGNNRQLTIYARGTVADSTDFNTNLTAFASYTDSTRYLRIVGQPGHANGANNGVWSTSRYRFERNVNGGTIEPGSGSTRLDYRIENIQIHNSRTTSFSVAIRATQRPGEVYIIGNIIKGQPTGLGGYDYLIDANNNGADTPSLLVIANNIMYDHLVAAIRYRSNTDAKLAFYNNTVVGCGTGEGEGIWRSIYIERWNGSNTTVNVRNNILQGASQDDLSLNGDATNQTTSNNITSDASSETVGLRNISLTFADATNKDYRLVVGSTQAVDAGADLSGDGTYAFSTDIVGSTRGATWDIGAHELISSGPSLLLLHNARGGND